METDSLWESNQSMRMLFCSVIKIKQLLSCVYSKPCRGCEVHSSECHTVPEKGGVKYIVCNISSICYAVAQTRTAACCT